MAAKQDNLDTIIEAATKAFAQNGFAGARMDDIARRAKVNKATIYYKIGNKEALYAAVLMAVFDNNLEETGRAVLEAKTPEAKLGVLIRAIASAIDANPALPNIIMWEHASGGQTMPEPVAEKIAGLITILTMILEQGESQGVFKPVRPMLIQFMIVATLMFYRTSAPIRQNLDAFPAAAKNLPDNVSGPIADELENLILNALKIE